MSSWHSTELSTGTTLPFLSFKKNVSRYVLHIFIIEITSRKCVQASTQYQLIHSTILLQIFSVFSFCFLAFVPFFLQIFFLPLSFLISPVNFEQSPCFICFKIILCRACCRQYGVCLQQLLANHATEECDAANNMAAP
jgi:hypothetical protein